MEQSREFLLTVSLLGGCSFIRSPLRWAGASSPDVTLTYSHRETKTPECFGFAEGMVERLGTPGLLRCRSATLGHIGEVRGPRRRLSRPCLVRSRPRGETQARQCPTAALAIARRPRRALTLGHSPTVVGTRPSVHGHVQARETKAQHHPL